MDRDEEMGHGDRSLLFIGDEDDDLEADRDGGSTPSSDPGSFSDRSAPPSVDDIDEDDDDVVSDGRRAPRDDDDDQRGTWPQSFRSVSIYLTISDGVADFSDEIFFVFFFLQAIDWHDERRAVAGDELDHHGGEPESGEVGGGGELPPEASHEQRGGAGGLVAAALQAAAAAVVAVAAVDGVGAAGEGLGGQLAAARAAATAAAAGGVRGAAAAAEAVVGVPEIQLHRPAAAVYQVRAEASHPQWWVQLITSLIVHTGMPPMNWSCVILQICNSPFVKSNCLFAIVQFSNNPE